MVPSSSRGAGKTTREFSPLLLILADVFSWLERSELPAIIHVDNVGICHGNNHVRLSVAIHVAETDGHHCYILSVSVEGQALIDFRFGCIPCGKLDDLNVRSEVHRDKMARTTQTVVVVADHCIYLIGAGPSVMPIILRHIPPMYRYIPKHPENKHESHATP